MYRLAADAVLVLHLALVLFVIGGLLLVWWGHWRRARGAHGWRWVDGWTFRLLHLATIGVVVAESWLGIECPLTTLERWLRQQAGAATYAGGFIEHALQALLYWQAPAWVFTLAYSGFGLAVLASWWRFPPRRGGR